MKITGGSNYIKFDLENGYVLKANGEKQEIQREAFFWKKWDTEKQRTKIR